jgi:hypothetical protein
MKKSVASMFAATLLAVTSLVFVPGASARNGGNSCNAFIFHANVFSTPAGSIEPVHSEIYFCD